MAPLTRQSRLKENSKRSEAIALKRCAIVLKDRGADCAKARLDESKRVKIGSRGVFRELNSENEAVAVVANNNNNNNNKRPKRTSALYPVAYADERDDFECKAFAFQIYEYLRSLADECRLGDTFLSAVAPARSVLNSRVALMRKSRALVLNWLFGIHKRFHMKEETLHLMVSYLDRYIDRAAPKPEALHLVGLTCFLVASKYEEMYIPTIDDFLFVTKGSYDANELLEQERSLLKTLQFSLGHPVPIQFLKRAWKIAAAPRQVFLFALFLVELWFFDADLIRSWTPAHVAAIALFASMSGHGVVPTWPKAVAYHMDVKANIAATDAKRLCALIDRVDKLGCKSVQEKYVLPIMGNVAIPTYKAITFLRSNGFINNQTSSNMSSDRRL